LIRHLGATPVVADALAADTLKAALAEHAPDAVVHALTALPKRGPLRVSELGATDRVRIEGTANLLEAAVAPGGRRPVAESVVLVYGDTGDTRVDETTAWRPPHPALRPSMDAVRSLEEQVLGASRAGRLEGIVLRYGIFYGPGVASTDFMIRMMRWRLLPLFGGGCSVVSWVHVDDAAAATVAAVGGGQPGGGLNLVGEEPAPGGGPMTQLARGGAAV